MKKLMITGIVAMTASLSALAATVFPAGATDISATDETGWNDAIPADAQIQTPSDQLKASSDVTFSTLLFQPAAWASGTYVLDLTPATSGANRKISLTTTDTSKGLMLTSTWGTKVDATIKGGVFDFAGGKGGVLIGADWHDAAKNGSLTLDGTVVTNAYRLFAGESTQTTPCGITLKGGAKVYQGGSSWTKFFGGYASNCFVTVTEKSSVVFGSPFYMINGTGWRDLKFSVLDGSSVTMKSSTSMGETSNERILISGASSSLDCKGTLDFGWNTGTNSELRVENGGTLTTGNNVYLGSGTYTDGRNTVVIGDGGTWNANDLVLVGTKVSASGKPADLIVSNGALHFKRTMRFGTNSSSDSRILVTGSKAVFDLPDAVGIGAYRSFFGNGSRLSFTIDDNATVDAGHQVFGYGTADDCEFRVCNGASYACTNLWLGPVWANPTALAKGNRLIVENGATVAVGDAAYGCCPNAVLAVSNATFTCQSTVDWGYPHNDTTGINTNDTLILRGTTPSFEAKKLRMRAKTRLRYEIAAGGYADNYVPVSVETLEMLAGAALEVDLSRYLADAPLQAEMTLLRATSSLSLDADALAAAKASVEAQCAERGKFKVNLFVSGNDLVLKIKKRMGLIITIR